MLRKMLILFFVPITLFAQTYVEFSGYSQSYIYSNLYYAVNERAYGTMNGILIETNIVSTNTIITTNEIYAVDPMSQLYEVAFLQPPEYEKLITTNQSGAVITNLFLSYEDVYPSLPDTTNYAWSSLSNSEYPQRTNSVLIKKAENFSRYMWAKFPEAQGFYRLDLGLEIHKKVAELVNSGIYGITNDIIDAMNTPVKLFDKDQQYEWVPGNLVIQRNNNLYTSPYDCWDLRYEPEWITVGTSVESATIADPGTPDYFENCQEYRITFDTNTQSWVEIGLRHPSKYPALSHTNFVNDGIGFVVENPWVENFDPPEVIFGQGWRFDRFLDFLVYQTNSSATNLESFAAMTNYTYGKQLFVEGGTNYINVKSVSPSVFINFVETDYSAIEEEIFLVTNEIKKTETKTIALNIQNVESLNEIPNAKLYNVDDLMQNIVQDENVLDQANVLFYYSNAKTNSLLDLYSAADLPSIDVYQLVAEWGQITNEGGFVISDRAPIYRQTNNTLNLSQFVQSKKLDEPYGNGYKVWAVANTNNSGLFTYTNGNHFYTIEQITYSISTNLNQPFPDFPTHETWMLVSSAKPLHLSPGYAGETARISKPWLYKKWQQLKMMHTAQALFVTPTTNYVDENTNYYTSIQTFLVNGQIQTQSFGNASFDKTTITETDRAIYEREKRVDLGGGVISDFERTSQTKTEGSAYVYKSKKISSTLNLVKALRYNSPRYFLDTTVGLKYFYRVDYIRDDCRRRNPYDPNDCREFAWRVFRTTLIDQGFDRELDESADLYSTHNAEYAQFVEIDWQTDLIDGLQEYTIDDIVEIPTTQIECIGIGCNPTTFTLIGSTQGSIRGYDERSINTIFVPVWRHQFLHPMQPE